MNEAIRRKLSGVVSALVCIALALSVILATGSVIFARADGDENTYTPFLTETMNPSNNQFSSSSGAFPKTPDSWTGSGVGGKDSGNIVSGVMNLDSYAENKDKYYLSKDYSEFAGVITPDSPFGHGTYEGTDRNVLFINSRENNAGGTAYGYSSSTISFTAGRFYMIKAWVRTSNFVGSDMGAAIRLNGLDDDVAFNKINTVKDLNPSSSNKYGWTADKNYGWQEFTFYVAAPTFESKSVTVSLQLGDSYNNSENNVNYYYPAIGYAFFDNIQAYQISPAEFLEKQKKSYEADAIEITDTVTKYDNVLFADYSVKTDSAKFGNVANLNFTEGLTSDNWQFRNDSETNLSDVIIDTYSGYGDFSEKNQFHLTSDPASSLGKYADDSDILVISSYTNGSFNKVAAGVSSNAFTVERYHYYRVSAWVKTQDIDGGSGASLAISSVRTENDKAYNGKNLYSTITNCTGDDTNTARGGFKQYSFYIKGSIYDDFDAHVECWLGTMNYNGSDNYSSGIAMFDNVTIEEITPAVYASSSSNGTKVDMDTTPGPDGDVFRMDNSASSTIANSNFTQVGEYKEFAYPLTPASWTYYDPQTSSNAGYSADMQFVETDGIISGIIPTDEATYNKYKENFGKGVTQPRSTPGSLLMMYSSKPTAYGYRSSAFSISADTPTEVTVDLWANNIKGKGGVALVLKSDENNVIATIEGIKETFGFKTFRFYVEPNSEAQSTMYLEIWLGYMDRNQNDTKLAQGHVYVQSVTCESISGDNASQVFAEKRSEYDNQRRLETDNLDFATYSFKATDLSAYDYYDTNYVKYPYNWNLSVDSGNSGVVHYGIFNSTYRPAEGTSIIPSSFRNENAKNYGVLVLNNAAPAYSTLSYKHSFSLSADTYYKIDVSLKVAIPTQYDEDGNVNDKAVGATLSLIGTNYAFKDIKDTSIIYDSSANPDEDVYKDTEIFRTFTFYINPGATDTTVSLSLSLGGNTTKQRSSGYVYVNDITFTDITDVAFDEAVADVEDNGDKYGLIARLAESSSDDTDDGNTDTNGGNKELDWWLIPSILFAVAILIAVVGYAVRRIVEKRAAKKGVTEKKVSYDRELTLNRDHNEKSDDADKVAIVDDGSDTDSNYEKFDDTATEKLEKQDKKVEDISEFDDGIVNTEAPAEEKATEEASSEEAPAEEKGEEEKETAEESTETANTEKHEAKKAAEVKPESKPKANPDAFDDSFDD